MKKTTKQICLSVVLFFVSVWVVIAAGITEVVLENVRAFGLVMLTTAVAAGLLVVYFEWRARLFNGIRDERHEPREAV